MASCHEEVLIEGSMWDTLDSDLRGANELFLAVASILTVHSLGHMASNNVIASS